MPNTKKDIEIDFILPAVKGQCKKTVFEGLLGFLSGKLDFPADQALERLLEKEAYESCTIGNGAAVPHVRIAGLKHPVTLLARLEKPANFSGAEKQKVDLVCMVLSPQNAGAYGLMNVSRAARMLQDKELCRAIRDAKDEESINNAIYNPDGWFMAA